MSALYWTIALIIYLALGFGMFRLVYAFKGEVSVNGAEFLFWPLKLFVYAITGKGL
jgi:hypothetical protein